MNSFDTFAAAETDYRRVPTERLSHPKDGALAQQPKAERAPHSAVERPQAAGKSRSTSPVLVSAFVPLPAHRYLRYLLRQGTAASGMWHRGQGPSIAPQRRALNAESVGLNQHQGADFFAL